MLPRDDAPFKKVVDQAMIETYRSGAISAIYDKWFLKPIPPKGINLNVPMSAAFKKVMANPTDSGDPAVYSYVPCQAQVAPQPALTTSSLEVVDAMIVQR
jgi:glutamate/aspartate transport system substrate-binding protein